jgi:hypothetical protein
MVEEEKNTVCETEKESFISFLVTLLVLVLPVYFGFISSIKYSLIWLSLPFILLIVYLIRSRLRNKISVLTIEEKRITYVTNKNATFKNTTETVCVNSENIIGLKIYPKSQGKGNPLLFCIKFSVNNKTKGLTISYLEEKNRANAIIKILPLLSDQKLKLSVISTMNDSAHKVLKEFVIKKYLDTPNKYDSACLGFEWNYS